MTKKPIIHTEYAHSLGLAFGDFEAKYDRILREEKVIEDQYGVGAIKPL